MLSCYILFIILYLIFFKTFIHYFFMQMSGFAFEVP